MNQEKYPIGLKIAPVDQINELEDSNENNNGDESDQAFEKLFDQLVASKENGLINESQDPSLEWLKEFQSTESEGISSDEKEVDQELIQFTDSEATTEESILEVNQDLIAKNDEMEIEDTISDQSEEQEFISENTIEVELPDQNGDKSTEMETVTEDLESSNEKSENSMAWLEALSENQILNQSEDTNISNEISDFPEWVKTFDKTPDGTETLDDTTKQSVPSDQEANDETPFELPDWLQSDDDEELEQSEGQPSEVASEEQSFSKEEDLLGELEGVSIDSKEFNQ